MKKGAPCGAPLDRLPGWGLTPTGTSRICLLPRLISNGSPGGGAPLVARSVVQRRSWPAAAGERQPPRLEATGTNPWIPPVKKALIVPGCLLALAAFAPMEAAWAQRSSQVQFKPGNYGTMVSGTITGREYIDYKLTANKGQKMFAELAVRNTNGNGSVYFNILPPGSRGEAIYIGHMNTDKSAIVTLPSNGTYTIRVYLMGNDKDAGKTVGFNLDLSIQ
ncbi:MAG: hypothetical protein VKI81_05140 [Synechococcaceae cyanobacterium]|nr:hypothetical protein [Synechococcaceae cyanobacterium]